MTVWLYLLAFIAVQRFAELTWSARNTHRLRAAGAEEIGAAHYPLIVLLHGAWLASFFLLVPTEAELDTWFLVAFVVLQVARLWVIATLGRYWTTRIVTLSGAPLVRCGPYRWVRHPNYLVVALEIPVIPMIAGAWQIASVFGLLNLALLAFRIRVEDRALSARRGTGA